ncbi:MAG: hypothetical protein RBR37_10805 [Advenella sp.]|nr:hypothetical protein [Advenella sp.]
MIEILVELFQIKQYGTSLNMTVIKITGFVTGFKNNVKMILAITGREVFQHFLKNLSAICKFSLNLMIINLTAALIFKFNAVKSFIVDVDGIW